MVEERDNSTLNRWRQYHALSRGRALRELAGSIAPVPPAARSLRVAVLGGFSAGKSTFISSLIGEAVAESHSLPTTRALTRIQWSPVPQINHLNSGKRPLWRANTRQQTARWFSRAAVADFLPPASSTEGLHLEVGVPADVLRGGLCLLDTPGHDSTDEADRLLVSEALSEADAVLYVCRRTSILSDVDLRVLADVQECSLPWA